ncbi:SET domain-containing protein SmydA-8 [Lepeophtheirus salmonis]|uniref:SET domain-containing protein SmydA-8 n=1 Tax=Lepeophtheirus salmonis TaxID=72036 RepID=UPI001AE6EAF7|nr:SET domain-containing protein SmydA-8-like [Lepeophtheirus salmonis]
MINEFSINLYEKSCKLEIKAAKDRGRGLFACHEISKDTVIYKESPFVVGPPIIGENRTVCITCSNTIHYLENFCRKCSVGMCSNCSHLLEEECSLFEKHRNTQKLKSASNWIAILRVILRTDELSIPWKKLEDHSNNNYRMKFYKDYIANDLKKVHHEANESEVLKIASILDSNSFRINKHSLRGLFGVSSFINHDCNPNARVIFDRKGHLHLISKKTIEKGEEISISYVAPLLSTRERREKLMSSKFFYCQCKRCHDPTELGSHLSSLLCPKCQKGRIVQTNDILWNCIECGFETQDEKVNNLLQFIVKKLENNSSSIDTLDKTIKSFEKKLPQSHSIMLEYKKRLIDQQRKSITLEVIDQKLHILSQRLDILHIIEGDCDSRLKGFLSYQIYELLMGKIYLTSKSSAVQGTDIQKWRLQILKHITVAKRILSEDNNCPPDLWKVEVQ